MKWLLLPLLLATKSYSFCHTNEAQVMSTIVKVVETKTSCHYYLKVNDINEHMLCPLTQSEIEQVGVTTKKYAGVCHYEVGERMDRILVKDNKTDLILLD